MCLAQGHMVTPVGWSDALPLRQRALQLYYLSRIMRKPASEGVQTSFAKYGSHFKSLKYWRRGDRSISEAKTNALISCEAVI